MPRKIITDNDTNLNNKMMGELCEEFKIQQHNSMPYRRKMNRAVEAANKNIKKIIQKMIASYKDWHEMLPSRYMVTEPQYAHQPGKHRSRWYMEWRLCYHLRWKSHH